MFKTIKTCLPVEYLNTRQMCFSLKIYLSGDILCVFMVLWIEGTLFFLWHDFTVQSVGAISALQLLLIDPAHTPYPIAHISTHTHRKEKNTHTHSLLSLSSLWILPWSTATISSPPLLCWNPYSNSLPLAFAASSKTGTVCICTLCVIVYESVSSTVRI